MQRCELMKEGLRGGGGYKGWRVADGYEPPPVDRVGSRSPLEGGWNIQYRNHKFRSNGSQFIEQRKIERHAAQVPALREHYNTSLFYIPCSIFIISLFITHDR